MDIPAEIPTTFQPIWEGGYNQAIGEGKGAVDAIKHAWDVLERHVFESGQLWQPIAKYSGSNWEIVKKDINRHRVTIIENGMSVEEVLKMYGITHSKPDYDKIYAWLEKGLIRGKHWIKSQINEPV
jgi:hypothetical protein